MNNKFIGLGTALVTPFTKDGALDEKAFTALVERQIRGDVNFLVPCGTTGESPTLSHKEHLRVVELTMEVARPKGVPVLAGCGGYNTKELIELGFELKNLGVDGLLSVTPYYNKPTQEGLYKHYEALALAVELPIILYSVQGRTGINIEPQTVKRLSQVPGIIGIKDRKVIGTNISIQPINFQAYLEGQLWPHGRTYHKGVINAMRAAKRAKDEDSLEIFRGAVWNIHHKEHLTKLFGEDK